MAKQKLDYQKLTYPQMSNFVTTNKDKLIKEKGKDEVLDFLKLLNKDGKKNTLGARKKFYELSKDYIDFENAPNKKTKKVDKDFEAIENLIKELEG